MGFGLTVAVEKKEHYVMVVNDGRDHMTPVPCHKPAFTYSHIIQTFLLVHYC